MNWWSMPANELQVTHRARLWLYVVSALVMMFLVLPSLIVVPMSFSGSAFLRFPPPSWSTRWYSTYFHSPEWIAATLTSLKVAMLTVLVAVPLGTACAYVVSRAPGRLVAAAFSLLLLPIVVPVILLAIGIYLVYARVGLLNSIAGLAIAHAVLTIPLVIIVMSASLRQADGSLELAARGLGVGRWRAFFLVTLPQLRVGLLTAVTLAFLTSLDEVVIALLIADGDAATVTRRMFLALRDQMDPVIAAISTMLIALSIILIVTVQVARARRSKAELFG